MKFLIQNQILQFAREFEAKRLRNWEVTRWYPETALPRVGKTVVVSNDRGHLLPGIPRSKNNPWGNYIGTWNLPKKIDRATADKLAAPNEIKLNTYKKRLNRYLKEVTEQQERKVKKSPKESPDKDVISTKDTASNKEKPATPEKTCNCPCECVCDNKQKTTEKEVQKEEVKEATQTEEPAVEPKVEKIEDKLPYIPGDLQCEQDRLNSYDLLDKHRYKQNEIRTSQTGFPQYKNYDCNSIEIRKSESSEAPKSIKCETISTDMSFCKEHNLAKRDPREVKTILDTINNFHLARELHKVNLEHEPLPDTVPCRAFRKMQMEQPKKHPGLAIKGNNYATAVGWKGYSGFGANRCTKLKVFRPKTGALKPDTDESGRPCSINSFDQKWRFIRQNKVTPIEMAICWDKRPENPENEPKRSKHIDGSNGSMAPAVFSMVQTPKENEEDSEERNEPTSGRNMPAIFSTIGPEADIQKIGEKPVEVRPQTTHKPHKTPEIPRSKSAYDLQAAMKNRELHQSTPNISTTSKCSKDCCQKMFNTRLCVACELKQIPEKPKRKEEYKMAFKAGKPNNSRSSSSTSSQGSIKVPKQRDPYGKRNYSIDSLAAPFCLHKGKREDYPEHWRLASVYQHSYKPIHMRKKTLLQSVYQ